MRTLRIHKIGWVSEQRRLWPVFLYLTQFKLFTNKLGWISSTYTKKAYQKLQEQNGAAKKDYANANMQPGQIVLSTVWAGVVFYFAYYFITGLAEGKWGKAEGTDILHGNLWNLPF